MYDLYTMQLNDKLGKMAKMGYNVTSAPAPEGHTGVMAMPQATANAYPQFFNQSARGPSLSAATTGYDVEQAKKKKAELLMRQQQLAQMGLFNA